MTTIVQLGESELAHVLDYIDNSNDLSRCLRTGNQVFHFNVLKALHRTSQLSIKLNAKGYYVLKAMRQLRRLQPTFAQIPIRSLNLTIPVDATIPSIAVLAVLQHDLPKVQTLFVLVELCHFKPSALRLLADQLEAAPPSMSHVDNLTIYFDGLRKLKSQDEVDRVFGLYWRLFVMPHLSSIHTLQIALTNDGATITLAAPCLPPNLHSLSISSYKLVLNLPRSTLPIFQSLENLKLDWTRPIVADDASNALIPLATPVELRLSDRDMPTHLASVDRLERLTLINLLHLDNRFFLSALQRPLTALKLINCTLPSPNRGEYTWTLPASLTTLEWCANNALFEDDDLSLLLKPLTSLTHLEITESNLTAVGVYQTIPQDWKSRVLDLRCLSNTITTLNFYGNEINYLSHELALALPRLTSLNLSSNPLWSSFSEIVNTLPKSLTALHINDCLNLDIGDPNLNLAESLPNLVALDIAENAWPCLVSRHCMTLKPPTFIVDPAKRPPKLLMVELPRLPEKQPLPIMTFNEEFLAFVNTTVVTWGNYWSHVMFCPTDIINLSGGWELVTTSNNKDDDDTAATDSNSESDHDSDNDLDSENDED